MRHLIAILLTAAGISCGTAPATTTSSAPTGTATGIAGAAPAQPVATATATAVADDTAGGNLQGYVVSAFSMTVDGQQYADTEAFYTAEMKTLSAQVAKAGYAGYTMKFDAQIGLADLTADMFVFAESVGAVGFAGNTQLGADGHFAIKIPNGAGDETFKIRTNKRVSVILTSADQQTTVKWCYNFSSADITATIHAPALIASFTTSLTQYQCDNSLEGLAIPTNPNATATGTATAVN